MRRWLAHTDDPVLVDEPLDKPGFPASSA